MSENKKNLTELSELGEFLLINKLTAPNITRNASTLKSIGDDCAVINYASDQKTVITNDLLVEGIHFNLQYSPLKYVGYKAVVVNLSDVYAMNAKPEQILVSVAVSNRFSVEALEELYKGIYEACEEYKVDLIGGDTTSSKLGMFLSITAIGKAPIEKIVYRNTANNKDLICVTGDLGASYMGLQVLEREKKIAIETQTQPNWDEKDYLLQRQLRPEARKDIIELFAEKNIIPTSMIDISDGLSSEIMHICNLSKTGAVIYEERLPIHQQTKDAANEMNLIPTTAAMNGGEDYELLFTIPLSEHDKIKDLDQISVIGHIAQQKEGINIIAIDGTPVPITAQGWNALLNEE
ncbi:MAG: thiamine-phosphate kinase [Bacteroidales bacterium]|nr:thiamine-phosphate kinase [Bacteroidales bacterium]